MKLTIILSLIGLSLASLSIADSGGGKKHEDHDHHQKQGPNHGRLLKEVEPHLEFLLLEDRKVQLTFVDDHNKVVPKPDATFSMICGDRKNPTTLTFEKKAEGFTSKEKLPEGKNIPTILRVKPTEDAAKKTIRFNIDLNDCPTCEYLEYACTCDHGGHDHDHD